MRHGLLAVTFLTAISAWAGSGSSSVGSASIPIFGDLAAALPEGFVQTNGNLVQDGKAPILSLSPIAQSELTGHWVSSQLGGVQGYEYIPDRGSGQTNSWAVCQSQGCVKLTPLSSQNPKIPAVIGSLVSGLR
jgi:hypothetical protein